MTLNYSIAVVVWVAMLAVVLAFTVPDVPVVPLLIASVVVFVAVPSWFYPRSKSLWAAIEFLIERSDPDYRSPVRRDPRGRDLE
jgi:membrane protease YdiL (CAAX protease family)